MVWLGILITSIIFPYIYLSLRICIYIYLHLSNHTYTNTSTYQKPVHHVHPCSKTSPLRLLEMVVANSPPLSACCVGSGGVVLGHHLLYIQMWLALNRGSDLMFVIWIFVVLVFLVGLLGLCLHMVETTLIGSRSKHLLFMDPLPLRQNTLPLVAH